MKYLNLILDYLDLIDEELTPCTNEEIQLLEDSIGVKLPDAYREYLLIMGRNPGNIFSGSDVEFQYLEDIQKEGKEIYESALGMEPSENTFFIYTHQGYSLSFFYLNEGEDPAVYDIIDGDNSDKLFKRFNTFSEYIYDAVDKHYQFKQHMKR